MKHGQAKHGEISPLYRVWSQMRGRCNNPKHKDFADYGARGITVDPRWDDYTQFVKDMGPRPDGYWLERRDNDLGYSPENCEWRSPREQNNNKRSNTLITCGGITRTLAEWGRITGIEPQRIRDRIFKLGWTPEEALFTTARYTKKQYRRRAAD